MVCVGIDVAKDKHDCCILDSDGMVRADCFTIPNNMDGFKQLLQTIRNCTKKSDKIKVGLEATGHYSYNILGCYSVSARVGRACFAILSVALAALIMAFECCLSGAAVGRRIFSFWGLTFNS